MSINIESPNISGQGFAQVEAIKAYLYRLSMQLNYALNQVDDKAQAVEKTIAASKTPQAEEKQKLDTFRVLKDLIIKSSDIVTAYGETIGRNLSGKYVAQSEFGDYTKQTNAALEANSQDISATFTTIEEINGTLTNIQQSTLAYIRGGELAAGVYGIEVGKRIEESGTETFKKYARFTESRLSFFDNNDMEVAFISDNELTITNATIKDSLLLGRYLVKVENAGDGNIDFVWS